VGYSKKWAAIILTALITTGVGIGVWYFMDNRPELPYIPRIDETNTDTTQTIQPEIPTDIDGITYTRFRTYAEITNKLTELALNYSNYAELLNLNEIYGIEAIPGRDRSYNLYALRITNESNGLKKPEVYIQGGIHGDEWTAPTAYTWFADWFLRNAVGFLAANLTRYQGNESIYLQQLLNTREIYILPCFNPDGFDRNRRQDFTSIDLNRDFDMNDADSTMTTQNAKVLKAFMNHHQFRIGISGHDGAHCISFPMDSTRSNANAETIAGAYAYPGNPLNRIGIPQNYAPPDYYFYDWFLAGLMNFTGNTPAGWYGSNTYLDGNLLPGGKWYEAAGCQDTWMYAGNETNEFAYIQHESEYPGAGLLFFTIEYHPTKNTPNNLFGTEADDSASSWVRAIRHQLLYIIDIIQPYLGWDPQSLLQNGTQISTGAPLQLRYQINGSLVVEETAIFWGTDPDPINNAEQSTPINSTYQGRWGGGTGFDLALDGKNDQGVWYNYNITLPTEPGTYYFVARAKVDQIYGSSVANPSGGQYTESVYARMIHERATPGWSQTINGTDGLETMKYSEYWYSPVLCIEVI
jgi:hypothetical protein